MLRSLKTQAVEISPVYISILSIAIRIALSAFHLHVSVSRLHTALYHSISITCPPQNVN